MKLPPPPKKSPPKGVPPPQLNHEWSVEADTRTLRQDLEWVSRFMGNRKIRIKQSPSSRAWNLKKSCDSDFKFGVKHVLFPLLKIEDSESSEVVRSLNETEIFSALDRFRDEYPHQDLGYELEEAVDPVPEERPEERVMAEGLVSVRTPQPTGSLAPVP